MSLLPYPNFRRLNFYSLKNNLLLFILLLTSTLYTFTARAQTQPPPQVQDYTQFANELDFNTDLSKKWALEFNFGQTFTTTPAKKNIFATLGQLYIREWVHYMPNEKWKLSFFYSYFYNKYVPEIDQRKAPEWRSAFQAIYYIHRNRSIISTRWRLEDRHIRNTDSVFEAVERLRGQIKMVYPFNGKTIAPKVFYGIASDELFVKGSSKVSGSDFFDRNRLTLAIGYCVANNIQVEFGYLNEYLPRNPTSERYNAFQLNLIYNNLFRDFANQISDLIKHKNGGSSD